MMEDAPRDIYEETAFTLYDALVRLAEASRVIQERIAAHRAFVRASLERDNAPAWLIDLVMRNF